MLNRTNNSVSDNVYQALQYLYPKEHRKEYSEQMVRTFKDLLIEQTSKRHSIAVWLRVSRELPLNIVEEHINNLGEMKMSNLKSNKPLIIGISE